MDLLEVDILGDSIDKHWYYQSKALALQKIIRHSGSQVLLDIGAGSGFFTKYLLNSTQIKAAWCVDSAYTCDWDEVYCNKPIYFRRTLRNHNADLILMMDVLEHVDNDIELIQQYVKAAVDFEQKDRILILSVPAFNWMWSGHDEFLGHKRRYNLQQVRQVVNAAGLKIEHLCYFYALVLPLAYFSRLVRKLFNRTGSQLSRHNCVINRLLYSVCSIEAIFFKKNKLFGLSVFCKARF